MKIAFIHPSWPGDEGTGATYTATQVICGLAQRGHDVTVYCPDTPPENVDIPSGIVLENLDLSGFPYHTNTQLNRALQSRVEEFDAYDVTNSYCLPALPSLKIIGRQTTSATGVTLNAYAAICPKNDLMYLDRQQCTHRSIARCTQCIVRTSSGHEEFSTPYRMMSRFGNFRLIHDSESDIETIDFFRAPSDHVKKNHVDFGFPADPIRVIPHPLNEQFLVDHRSDFDEPYQLLYVGYLESHKGVDKLVPILSQLRERLDSEIVLTVVGKGGLQSKMERQASVYGVADAVRFRGFIKNRGLPEVYASHDLFIHPGVWEEPLARVYLEALATGTPIVTRKYGSIAEIIGGGGITTDGTIEGFVDAIAAAITHERLRELSEGAKETVVEYHRSRVIDRIEHMYLEHVE
jgi:glycosyltransferase involved in cell wall biosynthesis